MYFMYLKLLDDKLGVIAILIIDITPLCDNSRQRQVRRLVHLTKGWHELQGIGS